MYRLLTGALALIATVVALSAGGAFGGNQPLAVTSTLDGKKVLPQQIRWLARPNVSPSEVVQVDYLIDGKLRWIEHFAPYNYGSDDLHGHLGYLFTSWLTPGTHRFTARVRISGGKSATDTVTARVVPPPAAPAGLTGTWTRTMSSEDQAKSDPKYGSDNRPPTGQWKLVVDRVGVWEIDPENGGIVQAYSASGDVLHSYAPITMLPKKANGDPGSIRRFGARIDAGGGVDCDESGPFGTYRWTVSGDQLTLAALREPCGQRRAVYEGTWTRVG